MRPASATTAFSRLTSQLAGRRWASKLTTASEDELKHFNALASTWWDVNGPQRILHKMNLLRMDFIVDTIRANLQLNRKDTPEEESIYIPPYNLDLLPRPIRLRIVDEQELKRDELLDASRLKILDVGCGGGILSESMARLRYVDHVKGIDLSPDVIEAAKLHMKKDPILRDQGKISYQLQAIEDVSATEKYDVITMFEMLEHVKYPAQVLGAAMDHLEVGGWLFLSTINRDPISWFTTIFMGEHVLRIVPVGTHNVEKYINEYEISDWVKSTRPDFVVTDSKGCIYLPAYGWKFTDTALVGNYFMAIKRVQ